ncbi:glycosyltransferase [Dyadobacter sp. CY107]|uniref:glycosyltransferase n=1 Tax=Dyadobacter fanqingshengii TaxID=2906443 RepID=UPI001F28EA37|nr:glycosyltransferase [Dyadobacter fanqingshengii]MCF2504702.1 glycosyltransferase [Dyadobacter fanqingshengii]
MKIVFDPNTGKGNRYVDIIVEGLRKKGYQVNAIKQLFRSFQLFHDSKVIHVNWFDNLDTPWDFVKRISKLFIFFLFKKKLVWTLHNRTPHGGRSVLRLQKLLTALLVRMSERIVIHCLDSKDIIVKYSSKAISKTVYIPHPDYIGEYGVLQEGVAIKNEVLNLLFIGAIKPYKNIELLIDVAKAFKPNEVKLVISGKPANNDYKDSLKARIGGCQHIKFNSGFVENDALVKLIGESDLVVLPYDLRSSLNSGTVILAFSYARSVICPLIGTVQDTNEKDKLLTYEYADQEEHYHALSKAIRQAVNLKKSGPDIFTKWGKAQYDLVADHNSKEKVVSRLDQLYKEIIIGSLN